MYTHQLSESMISFLKFFPMNFNGKHISVNTSNVFEIETRVFIKEANYPIRDSRDIESSGMINAICAVSRDVLKEYSYGFFDSQTEKIKKSYAEGKCFRIDAMMDEPEFKERFETCKRSGGSLVMSQHFSTKEGMPMGPAFQQCASYRFESV